MKSFSERMNRPMEPVKPSAVPLAREPVIDQRGGPIDRINSILRKPWSKREQVDGRHVDASVGGANKSKTIKVAIIGHYRDAGWIVRWVAGCRENGGTDNFHFRLPEGVGG